MPTRKAGLRLFFDRDHVFDMDQFKTAAAQIPHHTININKATQHAFARELGFFRAGKNIDRGVDNRFGGINKLSGIFGLAHRFGGKGFDFIKTRGFDNLCKSL